MAVVRRATGATSRPTLGQISIEELLERSGSRGVPVNVAGLAEYLGLDVVEEPMDDEMSGYLEFRGGRWVAGLNIYHHPNRKRFTLAHEIAHFILHRDEKQRFVDEVFARRQGGADPKEREADTFAAEILMPESAFRSAITAGVKSVQELAARFSASTAAVQVRARSLGYAIGR